MKNLLCVAVFFSCMTPRFHHNVSIYFLLLVLLLIIYFIKGSKTKLKISYTKIKDISVFAIWVLVAIIQLYGSVSINHSLVDIYYLVVGLFSVIALNLIAKDEDTFQKCFGVITLALLIHCAIGCFEIFRTTHLFEVGVIDTLHVGKPVSIFTNNNDFGTFVFVTMAIALAYVNKKFNGRKMLVFGSSIVSLCMSLIIYAQSDTTLLALFLLLVVFLTIVFKKKMSLISRVFVIICMVSVVLILLFSFSNTLEMAFGEFMIHERARVNLIRNGLTFLIDTWGLGIGYGNAQYYLQYKSIYNVFDIFYFHNWYLEILVCGGVCVFLLYMNFHIVIIKRFYLIITNRAIKDLADSDSVINRKIINCLYVSFLIFSVVSISSSANLYSEWVWMYLGLVSAYSNYLLQKYFELNKQTCSK